MLKFAQIGKRRMIGMIVGNILLGLGICLFKTSGMGNDPFSAMVMSVSESLHLSYSNFLVLLNSLIFIIEIVWGRKYIGIGTFANWFFLGYVAEFFISLFNQLISPPQTFLEQLPFAILGVIIISFGVSLYQTSDVGIAPYDCLALIMDERIPKLPYFWCRMICDATCAVICLLTGGLIGLGTFLCAFGLGPVIHFFNHHFSQKVLYQK
ncbi:MAG: rane protein [Herbinix sp.]|jgi:uncharacterized membrane protein YczE|nr:rane protein [Herbinix sp.]